MKHARHLVVLSTLLLGGCAVSSYCEGEQDYESAASVPVIQPSEGLQIKESTTALKIPPAPATPVPYGERVVDAKGKEIVRCLDQPPALALPEPKPVETPPPAETSAKPG